MEFNGDDDWMSAFCSSFSHNFLIIAGKLLRKTPKQVKTHGTAIRGIAIPLRMFAWPCACPVSV